ncbi:MAG: AAA family ATPase [Planctomycetes bacterium]|nr:AAA family ATPase [Planctomycetota bacterium]
MSGREVVPTGIPGLDEVLGGGLPRRSTVVVAGLPGAGKTILCAQVALLMARAGRRSIVATITSEAHDELIQELGAFDFFDPALVGEEVFFVSAYPWLKKGSREARELLLQLARARGAELVVIDGLRVLRDLWRDEARVREFMHDLTVGLAAAGCTGLFNIEYALDQVVAFPEGTTVDGLIGLSIERHGNHRRRRLEVLKLRGRRHLHGDHPVRIDPRGVSVTPRLETVTALDDDFEPRDGRASFGLPQLDALLRGGLPRESGTLIIGSTGIGKTLLSLHFAAAGARAGEPAVFVSFYEPPAALVRRAAAVGLDLEPLVRAGALRFEYAPPVDLDPDELAARFLGRVAALGAGRLVVDGMAEVERLLGDESREREFLTALMIHLRRRRVTTIYTKELSRLVGDVDLSDTPVSLIAENLVFARHVELGGEVRRVLSILKMRASGFDASLREFQIREDGLHVLAPLRATTGLLTGLAHLLPPGHAPAEPPS